jgi:hypothetical protein
VIARELSDSLRGWSRHTLADGAMFVPDDPLDGGVLRIREQLPLWRFRVLVERLLRDGGDSFRAVDIGPLVRFTTRDGEHAGLVTIALEAQDGAPAERTIACVVGDTGTTVVDGLAVSEPRFGEYRDRVRRLTETWYLGLGRLRRRRFVYAPPPGWPALVRPHVVEYLHPGYPKVPTTIVVMDACPCSDLDQQDASRVIMLESADLEPAGHAPLELGPGLSGQVATFSSTVDGARTLQAHAFLVDGRYLYRAHLACAPGCFDAAMAPFLELMQSIEPVPEPVTRVAAHSAEHWID